MRSKSLAPKNLQPLSAKKRSLKFPEIADAKGTKILRKKRIEILERARELEMKSKHGHQVRVFGQRSIISSFNLRPPNPTEDSREASGNVDSLKGSCISLSDFLDKKLHRNNVPPKVVKGKSKPFLSPVGCRDDDSVSTGHHHNEVKKEEQERNCFLDESVFEQFKHASAENIDGVPLYSEDEEGTSSTWLNDVHRTRKRKSTSGDDGEKHSKQSTRVHSSVMGGDPGHREKDRPKKFMRKKKPRHLYNHYANGSGWWDGDMEGVDSEEVGFNELWEGVGSTTFGGIEWH